jgi:Ni,Fe-hydrogenase III large subunit
VKSLSAFAHLGNGAAVALQQIPVLGWEELAQAVAAAVKGGLRVVALFGHRPEADRRLAVCAVLADDGAARLLLARCRLAGDSLPSLTPQCPQVHLFEREIAEQFGVRLRDHPWEKPVRFQSPLALPDGPARAVARPQPGLADFFRVGGEAAHEVGVGPVHAGIIEPGHFRFQCYGEEVLHLEISLGYQHRGIERALLGGPDRRTIHYMETAAGDTTVGHATAYCQAVEALAGCEPPARAQALRGIALELERIANHVGDLGALAGDVGFLPTAAYCGRVRGDFLNLTAELCGSRLGRGLVRPGGVRFDPGPERLAELGGRLERAAVDAAQAVALLWDTSSVMARFEDTGPVSTALATELGLVGPAARASGVDRDVRRDHPTGIWRQARPPVALAASGDVLARAQVRWAEVERSIQFIRQGLAALPPGPVRAQPGPLAPERLAVSLVEGWRGEICHVASTGADGRFERYKIVDPSFHNWTGLAGALKGQQISDFPLCNKSFNLSYCGHDL